MIPLEKLVLLILLTFFQCSHSEKVITLGDSYASGNGIHARRKDYDDTHCYVESRTIPGGKYAASKGLDHIVTACSRDQIHETVAQWKDLQVQYRNESANLWEGSVLIISTGINSARSPGGETFEKRLIRCLTQGHCDRNEVIEMTKYEEVYSELETFYTQLATEAAAATVRVMGYPKVFNSNRLMCFIPGITVREADYFDSIMLEVNERILAALDRVKTNFPNFDIQYVDLAKAYTNGACFPFRSRQVRNINLLSLHTSFHPTQFGYDKSYEALLETLNE